MTDTSDMKSQPLRPVEALKGLGALMRNHEDISQVYRVVGALGGSSFARNMAHYRQSPGYERARRGEDVRERLEDTAYLSSLPARSLGRAYLDFMADDTMEMESLMNASQALMDDPSIMQSVKDIVSLIRVQHDLWHVVTGYGTDPVGEQALMTFTYAQERSRGAALLFVSTLFKARKISPGAPVFAVAREAWRNANDAAWLLGADWVGLLEKDIEEVRDELRLTAPMTYLRYVQGDQAAADGFFFPKVYVKAA